MLAGFLWYSPVLFGKPWMKEMGYDPSDKGQGPGDKESRGAGLLGLVRGESGFRVCAGALPATGFHVWRGFVPTVQFTGALFT
jgi:hypothetical protein